MSTTFWTKSAGIPGKLTFMEGKGELPKLQVTGPNSSAEIYLDGAKLFHSPTGLSALSFGVTPARTAGGIFASMR